MKMLQHLFVCAGLCASFTWASVVHSADAINSASATIVAPDNVLESMVAAYSKVLFSRSTGSVSIHIIAPTKPPAKGLDQSNCGWAMAGGANNQCNSPTTVQVASDGMFNSRQGVSLSVTREKNARGVVMAVLAYN